jgi:small subunit ribosomal protein S16
MAVVIRLMRAGAKKRPFYRMVAADSRRQRDGRFLEILGHYNPIAKPFELVVHKDKVQNWIAKGAQPSEQVASLLRSLDIPVRPAREPRTAAAPATPAKRAARRKPRPPSARKVKARALRAAKKKAPAKA